MIKMGRLPSIYAKQQKRGYNDEDQISRLPDEILVYILSLLTMDEAARTSVLSYRWKMLWAYIPSLNFNASKTLDELQLDDELLEIERLKYICSVNQVVKSYQGPTVEEFRVRFDLNKSHSFDINTWVNFAIEKRVKRFELDLSDYFGTSRNMDECYTFPHMCRNIKRSRSRPLVFSRCNSLTFLQLSCVNITGEVIEYFLSNCPFLEKLCVRGSDGLVELKVAGPSLNLKYLEIFYCFSVKNIEISAEKLVSFKYFGPRISMPFKKVPQLVEIYIGGNCCRSLNHGLCQLSSYIFQLRSLTLDSTDLTENVEYLPIPKLDNLRHLKLKVSAYDHETLLGFTPLIEACPLLCTFALELNWTSGYFQRKLQKATRCSHQHLKVIEFVGFVGRTVDVELAIYLIENSCKLEKVIFDTRDPYLIGSPFESEETKVRQTARKRAKQLGRKLPRGTDLDIV